LYPPPPNKELEILVLCVFPQILYQLGELGRLSASMKKIEKHLKKDDKYQVSLPFLLTMDCS
jgi:hypothetical protein